MHSIGEVFDEDFEIFIGGLNTTKESLFRNFDRSFFSRFTFISRIDFEMLKESFNIIARYSFPQVMLFFSIVLTQLPLKTSIFFFIFAFINFHA